MPPRKGRRNSVSSDIAEHADEIHNVSVRRPTRKRRAEEVEVESEEVVSEALSDGPVTLADGPISDEPAAGSSTHPVVLSSSSTDSATEVIEPDLTGEDAVEAARRFDQDEEYARQLQAEEYTAAAVIRDPFIEIARRVVQLRHRPLSGDRAREMAQIHREMLPNFGLEIHLSDQDDSNESEQELDFAHELDSEGYARRHNSDSEEEDEDRYYEDDYDEADGTDYSDYEDYNGADNADIIRMYREAAGNTGTANTHPFIRLVDFLEQFRHGQRVMNAVGPFIADEDFDPSYEALINLSERIGEVAKKGMPVDQIAKLKLVQWTEQKIEETPSDSRNCPICLETYQTDDKLMVLDCTHRFHWECAKRWLTERATCPICRISTRNEDTK